METNIKTKFINNIWVTGIYENNEVIGRTCLHNNINMVTIIDKNAIPLIIHYDKLKNICKITFVNKTKTNNKIVNNKKFISDFIKNQLN